MKKGILLAALVCAPLAQAGVDPGKIELEAVIDGKKVVVGEVSTYNATVKPAAGFYVEAIGLVRELEPKLELVNVCANISFSPYIRSCLELDQTEDGSLQLSDVYRDVYPGLILLFAQSKYGDAGQAHHHAIAFEYKKSIDLRVDQPRDSKSGETLEGTFPYLR